MSFSNKKDCMHVASEEGDYSFKKVLHLNERENAQLDSTVCGLYILTDPDKFVEISIKYLDVNCASGGLMAVNGFLFQFLVNAKAHQ